VKRPPVRDERIHFFAWLPFEASILAAAAHIHAGHYWEAIASVAVGSECTLVALVVIRLLRH
jgi:hypothetical protein